MSSPVTRVMDRISQGGPILHGQAIEFDLCFEDGTADRIQCSYENLPKIFHALKQFGEMAERLRRKGPEPSAEVVSPYRAGGIKAGKNWDGSLIALEFRTEEGMPLLISMTPGLAQSVIAAVTDTLVRLPFGSDPRS
jgi:hypothetical protein